MNFFKRLFRSTNKKQEYKLPDGWTETKISDNAYITHIPQEQKDKWVADRHMRDNVNELIKKDGFYEKVAGRAGTIYHADNGRLCKIDFEISGARQYDLLIFFDSLKEWLLPDKKAITPDEKMQIKEKLKLWLDKKNIKAKL